MFRVVQLKHQYNGHAPPHIDPKTIFLVVRVVEAGAQDWLEELLLDAEGLFRAHHLMKSKTMLEFSDDWQYGLFRLQQRVLQDFAVGSKLFFERFGVVVELLKNLSQEDLPSEIEKSLPSSNISHGLKKQTD